MTKMQVLANCVMTVLWVCLINTILTVYPIILSFDKIGPEAGLFIIICSYLLLCALSYFIFCKQQEFTLKLAGNKQPNESSVTTSHFVKASRVALIFAGLMLLPKMTQGLINLITLPAILRSLIFAVFGSELYSHQLPKDSKAIAMTINSLVYVCLTTYLIIGAPAYVKWQIRKGIFTKSESGIPDDPKGE
jgi:hypothetical protein